ncbi:MAG TPA: GAF domain-containing protein [Solirubrobacteraceae bacterium]|nr:GAF domain-containing protein [Solirubrobacteraceae bacterium]
MDVPRAAASQQYSIAALDLLSDVLSRIDEDLGSAEFYSRLAEAVCRIAQMRRAVIFSYDDARRRVHAAGSYGIGLESFSDAQVTVESAPIARQALTDDRVIEVLGGDGHVISEAFAELVGEHPIVYVPIVAAGRWLGVILAEPEPGASPLEEWRRDLLWMLGKTLALASTSRIATYQGERAREFEERIDFARVIHEGVVQRLFGVSLALSSEQPLTAEARARCAQEVGAALGELRSALQRPLGRSSAPTDTTLAAELDRLRAEHPDLGLTVEGPLADVPPDLEALSQSVLAEAVRNARKHADPRRLVVRTLTQDDTLVLEIENDGVPPERHASTGVGLRLAALEALQAGGLVEFGEKSPGTWQVRLVVPLSGNEAT